MSQAQSHILIPNNTVHNKQQKSFPHILVKLGTRETILPQNFYPSIYTLT